MPFFLFMLIGICCAVSCTTTPDSEQIESCYTENYRKQVPQIKKDSFFKFVDSDTSDTSWNFTSRRAYTDDSVFVDYGMFGSSDTDIGGSIYFKIENSAWYVFNGHEWKKFYAEGKLYEVELLYRSLVLIPKQGYVINAEQLYSFSWIDKSGWYPTEIPLYFFSPKHGIVVMKFVSGYFRRKDFSPPLLDTLMNAIM